LSFTVLYIPFGTWKIRKAILAGQKQSFIYHWDRIIENMTINARQVVKEAGSGDIADGIVICDLLGYTLREQGCLSCELLFSNRSAIIPVNENSRSLLDNQTPPILLNWKFQYKHKLSYVRLEFSEIYSPIRISSILVCDWILDWLLSEKGNLH
jgi:hypothetical protein